MTVEKKLDSLGSRTPEMLQYIILSYTTRCYTPSFCFFIYFAFFFFFCYNSLNYIFDSVSCNIPLFEENVNCLFLFTVFMGIERSYSHLH